MSIIDIAIAVWNERRTERIRTIVEEVFCNLTRFAQARQTA